MISGASTTVYLYVLVCQIASDGCLCIGKIT